MTPKDTAKRAAALGEARLAGYHEDRRQFTRLVVESGVGYSSLAAAWAQGQRAKAAGVPCGCSECKP